MKARLWYGLAALCTLAWASPADARILSVSDPPSHVAAAKVFRVQVSVVGPASVRFVLSRSGRLSLADPELAGTLSGAAGHRAAMRSAEVTVPAATPSGSYRLLACQDSSCRASRGKVKVAADRQRNLLAFSDAHPIPPSATLKSDLASIFRMPCLPAGSTPGLPRALRDARSFLRSADAAGTSRLATSSATRTPGRAMAVATGAIAAGKPDAALAAFLDAYRRDARDPALLIDMAGVMTPLGMPRDALALLDAADALGAAASAPAGFNMQAVSLDDRGYAEMAMCRWGAASSALNAAIALAPAMREARVNLAAIALATQGTSATTVKDFAGAIHRDPSVPVDVDPTGRAVPLAQSVFDMSHPVLTAPDLPDIKLDQARTVEQVAGFGATYPTQGFWVALDNLMFSPHPPAPVPPSGLAPATLRRYTDILSQVGDSDPSVASLRARAQKSAQDVKDVMAEYFGGQCAEFCRLANGHNAAAACARTRQVHGYWLGLMHAYLEDSLNLIDAEYRHGTALAANLANPTLRTAALDTLDTWVDATYGLVTQQARYWASSIYHATVLDETTPSNPQYYSAGGCILGSAPAQTLPTTAPVLPEPTSCEAIFGKAAFSINLIVLSLKLGCEEIAAKVASPELLGPFIQGGYNWATGQITVFGGVKVGGHLGDTNLGGELAAGVYITVDRAGIEDVGVRATASAGYDVGNVKPQISGKLSYGVADMASVGAM